MNIRPMLIANGLLIALMVALSVWAWQMIPDGAQVAVHWNLDGQADRFGSKGEAFFFLPVMAVILTIVMAVLPRFEPRRGNLAASAKLWNAGSIGATALLAYVHGLLLLAALGRRVDILDYLLPAISVLFIVIGNYISKTRSNWFAGVRTPWTLSSDYSWSKTHQLASKLFMGSGVLTLVAWFFAGAKVAMIAMVATLIVTAVISIVASYVYWKNDPGRVHTPVNGQA